MSYTYKITLIGIPIDTSVCPPAIVPAIFPNFDGEPVELTSEYITVEFEKKQKPVNISDLVKVETI